MRRKMKRKMAERLVEAARAGDLDGVKELVDGGANVNATDTDGWTALKRGSYNGHLEVVRYLTEEGGTDVNATGEYIGTAVMQAASNGRLEVIRFLVEEHGADVNVTRSDGWTALMEAVCNGHFEVVQYLVEEGGADVNAMDKNRETAVMFAARNGHVKVVRYLVEYGGADVNVTNKNRETAVMEAAHYDRLEVVRYVVKHGGAGVNVTNKNRETAVMIAARYGHLEVVQCLVKQGGADVNTTSEDGSTALMHAVSIRRLELVRYLVEEGGADVYATNKIGETVLMRAARSGKLEVVRYLVEVHSADVNATSKDGKSAIRFAADRGHQDIVRFLTPLLMHSHTTIPETSSFNSLYSSWIIPPSEIELAQRVITNNLGGEYIAKWLDAHVIVKLFIPDAAHTSFQQEVKLWKQLRHPNVIKMYGTCEAGPGLHFFVCEYADGGSLIEYVKSTPEDEPRRVWKYLYEAALGLEYLHERGLVHGDLRCSNILIGSDGLSRLSNFGLSGAKSGASSSVGSMLWQAPEIMLGNGSSSRFASDVYSFGMCILEATTGKKPWDKYNDPKWCKTYWKPETDDSWEAPECPNRDARSLVWRMCSQDLTKRIKLQSVVYELERLALNESLRHSQSEPEHESVYTLDTYKFGEIKELWRKVETHMKTNNNQQYHQAFHELKPLYNHLHKSTHHITLFTRFHTLLTQFHTVITMNEQQTLAMRLSSTRATTNSIYAFHRRIQSLWGALGQLVDSSVKQTDAQRRDMFVSGVSDVYLLLSELESDDEKVAFLKMLKREMTHQYTSTQLEVMKKALEALESKIGEVEDSLIPEWFIPWYELIKREDECLGEGGFGCVIRAKWLDSEVVVKQVDMGGSKGSLLWSNMSSTETLSIEDVKTRSQAVESKETSPEELEKRAHKREEAMKMFRREVDIWFGFSHPHVIQLFGACHVGTPFFVCEYATNGTLVEYLRKHPGELWQKLYEAALGVQYLHARGVVHGDLKGNNIVIGRDMKAKVTDFGLSSMASGGGEAHITAASHWVAPECFIVDPELTFASDVYSLGMCIVESMRVVGCEECSLPWRDVDNVVVRVHAKRGELPPRPTCCTDAQWELVERMCAFQPENRMKISTVVDELSRLASERDETTTESSSLEFVLEVVSAMKTVLSELHESGSDVSMYLELWDELEKVYKNVDYIHTSSSSNMFSSLVKDAETATLKLKEKKADLISSLETTMAVYALRRRVVKFMEACPA